MSQKRSSETSWGQPRKEIDARVLRAYCRVLSRLAISGELLNPILLALLSVLAAWILVFGNLENIVFYDGTATTCVLDGTTRRITNAQ